MAIDLYDPSLDDSCVSCEDECRNDGCSALFAIGPCDRIITDVNPANGGVNIHGYTLPEDQIFDANTWCRVEQLNNVTFNLNQTIRKFGYVGNCFESTKPGRSRPTLDVDINFCRFDPSHCLLDQPGCLVAWLMMEDRADFIPNVSPQQQPGIRYGLARIERTSGISKTFDEEDNRTYTLHIHERFWEFNQCPGAMLPAQFEPAQAVAA